MSHRNLDLIDAEEKKSVGIAVLAVVLLIIAYWGVSSLTFLTPAWQVLLQAIITNLIPTLIVFVLAYVLLYRRIQKLRSEQEMESLARSVAQEVNYEFRKTLIELRDLVPAGRFGWLFTGGQVVEVEGNTKAKDVWVVSPHLLNDTDKEAFPAESVPSSTKATAQKNLKKKINYTFIVPDTVRIKSLLPIVKQNYEGLGGELRVIQLPPQDFEVLSFSEIAIYNPRMEGRSAPRVFIELPLIDSNAWWIEPTAEIAAQLVERVRCIVDGSKKQ